MRLVFRAKFKDGEDVRMIEGRSGKGLALKTAQAISVGGECGRENFYGDASAQPSVFRQIDFAHPAFAKLRADFVMTESGAGSESHHLKLLIITTSLLMRPREKSVGLPSRERSNQKISSDVKSVNCFGGPPSIGCAQIFETPFFISM